MKITTGQAEALLKGRHKFKQIGFSMLITRLKGRYAKDPTPENLTKSTDEINEFLEKFKPIMGPDFDTLKQL